MARAENGFSKIWSYAAFLVVGLIVAYAFLGVQFSSQLSEKESELASLRQQYGGLQGELEQARSPSQQVLNSYSPKDAEIERLTQELAAEKKLFAQCVVDKASVSSQLSACQAGSPASPTPSPTPSGRPDFVGKDIVLAKGESFSGQDGFTLQYVGFQPADGKVEFVMKSVGYTRNVGDFVYFTHTAGVEYVLSVNSADENSATFYVLARGKY